MIKDFLRGLTIGVGILFVFSVVGLVYAVGFHIADEVQSGTFGGDYEFVGDVDFTSANVVGLPESGINVSFADARYVNAVGGDTVTGNLRIDGAITNAVGQSGIIMVAGSELTAIQDGIRRLMAVDGIWLILLISGTMVPSRFT